jgi:mono/diheme cytochrome c family protein
LQSGATNNSVQPALTCHGRSRCSRAVNDPTATNVAQIVISGTIRHEPKGVISMPAFGSIYSDADIAAVANYVTGRFGSTPSNLTAKDVAELREETAR